MILTPSSSSGDAIAADPAESEAGFGLVEIVVSMFLIGIVAISFLPLLIQTMRVSAENVTFSAATQLVNEQLESARNQVGDCADLAAYLATAQTPIVDSRGIELTATRAAGGPSGGSAICTDVDPSAATFTVTVTRSDTSAVVAKATTQIFVDGG